MGNLPQSNFGQIYLRTINPFYYSGETVTGEIYLNLLESYPGNTITLKIKGKEECRWEEHQTRWQENQDGTRTAIQETIEHKGHNSFYRHKFPVFVFNGDNVLPGQYCFPFSLIPGSHLPGTFSEKEHHFSAAIKYKVKVELSPHHHHKHKVKDLKYTQELVLREPIKNQMMYNVPIENSINATTWCCISQGLSKIKCFFEKNTYCPGELANMICEIDNSLCDLSVRNVNIRLLMNIRLKTNHGREKHISETLNSYDLPGIGPHDTALGERRKVAGLYLTNQIRNRAIQPSTSGGLVKCEYVLAVKTVLDGVTCCSADPEVRIPLTVFAAPLVNFNQIAPPNGWSPQVMPAYNCVFSEGYAYASQKEGLAPMPGSPQPFGMAQPGMPGGYPNQN